MTNPAEHTIDLTRNLTALDLAYALSTLTGLHDEDDVTIIALIGEARKYGSTCKHFTHTLNVLITWDGEGFELSYSKRMF